MTTNKDSEQIGYLVTQVNGVYGFCCADLRPVPGVPIYRVNIGDYKQTCRICGVVLVEGKTPAWCELFNGK